MNLAFDTYKQTIESLLVVFVLSLVGACSKTPATPTQLKTSAIGCMRNQDYTCAEEDWLKYVRQRPNDGTALASLGITENKLDENDKAVVEFRKAIELGEGTYDLFSYYADSLAKLGKTDAAIDWSYKALVVVPTLVDVRGSLAKLLVQKKRYYEALVLLASFDDQLEASGEQPYFEGQRISIESTMRQMSPDKSAEKYRIRLPKTGEHYFAPVTLGHARVAAFMVDTGATVTSMYDQFLQKSKAKYEILRRSVGMLTADGRKIRVRLLNVDSIKVGPFELRNIKAVACQNCQLLLGQSALSQFDIASSRVEGVDFLTLKPRKHK